MKKITALLLALLLVVSLAACGASSDTSNKASTDTDVADTTDTNDTAEDGTDDADVVDTDVADTDVDAADSDMAYLTSNGAIVIGITEYAPMNYYDGDGNLIGFDTEFAEAVTAKLGLTPVFQVIDWSTKEVELKAKTIDCIWNGLTVNEDRRSNMDFSVSYLINEQVIVVRADRAADFAATSDFAGLTVVAEEGSAGETAALDLDGINYIAVAAQSTALLEVKSGTADAAIVDITLASTMTTEGSEYTDLAMLDIALTDEEYAIGFRLGSDARTAVDAVIAELIADGTLTAIAEKYDLADRLVK